MTALQPLLGAIDFEFLFQPFEELDSWLTGLLAGAPLLVALAIAFVLGLRHASDPDHLVAVTSLIAGSDSGTRDATRLGIWWGVGHATTLVLIGLPLIALKSSLPAWLETAAERGVGVVILVLAARVILKWARGDYRGGRHRHSDSNCTSQSRRPRSPRYTTAPITDVPEGEAHRHLRRGERPSHRHRSVRPPRQALAIGFLHGLAGTGGIVVLLLAALPTRLEAALGLAVFAPVSIFSMAACTTAFAWLLTRPVIEPVYRSVLIPALGLFGVMFGLWYAGLG
jgi:ABC-type nickel/cobalt efflux system permease component RcnA